MWLARLAVSVFGSGRKQTSAARAFWLLSLNPRLGSLGGFRLLSSVLSLPWPSLAPKGLSPGSAQAHGEAGTRAPLGPRAAALRRAQRGGGTVGGGGAVSFLPPPLALEARWLLAFVLVPQLSWVR